MTSNKNSRVFGIIMLLSGLAAVVALRADESDQPAFQIGAVEPIQIDWRGSPLLIAEEVSHPERTWMSGGAVPAWDSPDGWSVRNTTREQGPFRFRREVGIARDQREIEISFQGRVDSFVFNEWTMFEYALIVDLAALDGMHWRALDGDMHAPARFSGTLTSSTPDGSLVPSTAEVRWISFERDGRSLTFDLNPHGITIYMPARGLNMPQGAWRVAKEGDQLRIALRSRYRATGGTTMGKVRIFEGGAAQFNQRHILDTYNYSTRWFAEHLFSFGHNQVGEEFTPADRVYGADGFGFGWVESVPPLAPQLRETGAVYAARAGTGPAGFRFEVPRPGLYFLTLRMAAYDQPVGPFSITVDGWPAVSDQAVPPMHIQSISMPHWIEKGSAEVGFDGHWQVASLAVQPLITSYEDFTLRRGFWLQPGLLEPSPLFPFEQYTDEPDYTIAIERTPIPLDSVVPEGYSPVFGDGRIAPAPVDMPWRTRSTIGSMGPMNNGDFMEFPDDASLARRFDELEEEGFQTLIVNGLLSRHTFPKYLPRVTEALARYTAEAQRRGKRVIDHQDLTLLWQWGDAFRVLSEWTPWLQREVMTGNLNRGLCPNNPVFKHEFFERTLQLIRDTDLDGLMLDEVQFQDVTLCGCRHCRARFKVDTGLELPMDETLEGWGTMDSELYRLWVAWRQHVIGDWWVDFRTAISEVKPEFTLMSYWTEFGYTTRYGSHRTGVEKQQELRAIDFLGTESTIRNPFPFPATVQTFRRIPSGIADERGIPVFSLIYPSDEHIAFFGWALNNLNLQVTWWMGPPPVGADGFAYNFQENMDFNKARPLADTAVLFSPQSRDFSPVDAAAQVFPGYAYTHEALGWSHRLSESHRLHRMISDGSLAAGAGLEDIALLVVGNAAALSDAQVAHILNFAEQGGVVLASGEFALANEIGTLRKTWPLAAALGFTPQPERIERTGTAQWPEEDGIEGTLEFVRVQLPEPLPAGVNILARFETGGAAPMPMVFSTSYGKGRILYTTALLGVAAWEMQRRPGDQMVPPPGARFRPFLDHMIAEAHPTVSHLRNVQSATPIVTNLHSIDEGDAARYVFHVLNAGGGRVAPGANVPRIVNASVWMNLTTPVHAEVQVPADYTAYAVSPDFEGRASLDVAPLGDGWSRVALPPNLLKRYSMIYFDPPTSGGVTE